MIGEAELAALCAYASELEQQVDFLMRERTLYREGPQALEAKAPTTEPAPPGYAYGNAGQLILADHEMVYRNLWGDLPVKPVKRFRKPDTGDSVSVGPYCPAHSQSALDDPHPTPKVR